MLLQLPLILSTHASMHASAWRRSRCSHARGRRRHRLVRGASQLGAVAQAQACNHQAAKGNDERLAQQQEGIEGAQPGGQDLGAGRQGDASGVRQRCSGGGVPPHLPLPPASPDPASCATSPPCCWSPAGSRGRAAAAPRQVPLPAANATRGGGSPTRNSRTLPVEGVGMQGVSWWWLAGWVRAGPGEAAAYWRAGDHGVGVGLKVSSATSTAPTARSTPRWPAKRRASSSLLSSAAGAQGRGTGVIAGLRLLVAEARQQPRGGAGMAGGSGIRLFAGTCTLAHRVPRPRRRCCPSGGWRAGDRCRPGVGRKEGGRAAVGGWACLAAAVGR